MSESLTYLPYNTTCPHCSGQFRFAVGITGGVVMEEPAAVELVEVKPKAKRKPKVVK